MNKPTISRDDAETIMIALDQVSQTIDVMNMIVGRLKQRMHDALEKQQGTEERDSSSTDCHNSPGDKLGTLNNDQLH